MKISVFFVAFLISAAGIGFGVGFTVASLRSSYEIGNHIPTIDNFTLVRPVIENESGPASFDTFILNASEIGSPYEAGFQVFLTGPGVSITLASGSFYGYLNYTPVSFSADFVFASLAPNEYSIVAVVMHGSLSNSKRLVLDVLPSVSVSVSGPKNVSDSLGSVLIHYNALVNGGVGPYAYKWGITYLYYPNPQNFSIGHPNASSFNVTFSVNTSSSYYGTNQTFVISLMVTDSLGYSSSYTAESINGFEGYMVNVTGYGY
ncbi:MAG: hypothetical protein M1149_04065 [Candidatus Thermoplasmatota archaeon]|jgi:hypothetical protein|nr:hypothetical protein [Candidatus Thermoplasmatota archaeon]